MSDFTIVSPRILPNNEEAEVSLLGSLMLHPDDIYDIADILRPEDFYQSRHQKIYEAILDVFQKQDAVSLVSVSDVIQRKDQLDEVGGFSYLTQLINCAGITGTHKTTAKIIKDKALLREIIKVSNDTLNLAFADAKPAKELLDQAERELFVIAQNCSRGNTKQLKQIVSEAFDTYADIKENQGKLRGVTTGYRDLDRILLGLQKSDLVILAARPSMGKTTFALDIARHAAKTGTPVAIFSLEMSSAQLGNRMLAAEAKIDAFRMNNGQLSEDEELRLSTAMGLLAELPLFVDDTATLSVLELRTRARRLVVEHKVGLLVVDYLQLMRSGRRTEGEVQEITEISKGLKAIARELNIPVLALSQLSRNTEHRQDAKPQLADLRSSGSIEQDADVVMFIYRDEYYKGTKTDRPNIAEIMIKKHRNGPIGNVELYFDNKQVSFRDLDQTHQEGFNPQDVPEIETN